MFTGIIEAIGTVTDITVAPQKPPSDHPVTDNPAQYWLYTVTHPWGDTLTLGESIALSGMCTTVVQHTAQTFTVEVMAQSRQLTTFGSLTAGTTVNLERSAQIGQRNSGHMVLGHVDGLSPILDRRQQADHWVLRVDLPPERQPNLIDKGSITLDGIALTVSTLGPDWFEVSIIHHTWTHTTLHQRQIGDSLNIEYDLYGKYILRAHSLA